MTHRPTLKQTAAAMMPAIALLFAAPAWANEGKAQANPGSSAGAGTRSGAPVNPQRSEIDMRASRLIGMSVRDNKGENLGKIKEVVVDISSQRVRYAVVAAGGFLGIGDRHFLYPLNEFSEAPAGDYLIMNRDRDALQNASGFDGSDWPDFNDPQYRAQIDRSSGAERPRRPSTNLEQASELLGSDVKDRTGAEVGELRDLIVNLPSGEIRSAWVEVEDGARGGERVVSLPPARLATSPDNDEVILNMTSTELRDAPSAVGSGSRGSR
jgi:sporulation protein YlmC with PRC-barrel domain